MFSGLIAYGVQKNLDIPGKRPAWEWLFLIEGTVAIALGLLMIVLLPGNPDKMKNSWLLDDKELICAVARFQGKQNGRALCCESDSNWLMKISTESDRLFSFGK